MPSSPTKTSSEASAICHTDRLVFQPGRGAARTPSSAPRARAIRGTRPMGLPSAGLVWLVAPRASLLWKPWPQLA